jgi:hypothetical protein
VPALRAMRAGYILNNSGEMSWGKLQKF